MGVLISFSSDVLQPKPFKKNNFQDYVWDVFITLAFLLATTPVRPILQTVRFDDLGLFFDQGLARFDSLESMIILCTVGLPLLIFVILMKRGMNRIGGATVILLTICLVGYLNAQPNYLARIYESRAEWITRDWDEQRWKALEAIDDAETDQERAVAYYWLGVAENRQGNAEKTIEYQKLAIEYDASYGAPHSSISLAYSHIGEIELARKHANTCIELSPEYAWCYYALSAYYYYVNDLEAAHKNLKTALVLNPESIDFQESYDEFIRAFPQFAE